MRMSYRNSSNFTTMTSIAVIVNEVIYYIKQLFDIFSLSVN